MRHVSAILIEEKMDQLRNVLVAILGLQLCKLFDFVFSTGRPKIVWLCISEAAGGSLAKAVPVSNH